MRMLNAISWLAATSAMLLFGAGCSTQPVGPYSPLTEDSRQTAKAEKLNQQAADLMVDDPEKAEKLLRDALTADLYHGPSHNNLGILYLKQGKLYDAANEFEWARKLMPGHPDPRMNLAFTLESAGRVDEALQMYATALEVYPDHIPTVQALARLQVRAKKTDDRTERFLKEIALKGETEEWRVWARKQMARAE